MPETIYGLDAASMQRTINAVKKIEKLPTDLTGAIPGKNLSTPGMWVQITGKQKPGSGTNPNTGYSWSKVYFDQNSNMQLWTPAQTGNPPNGLYTAYEANNNDYVPINAIVWLVYNGNGNYEFVYRGPLAVGTWCPVSNTAPNCAGNAPTFTTLSANVLTADFLKDDFSIGLQKTAGVPCNPTTVLIQNKYNTFQHWDYATSLLDHACDTKVISLLDRSSSGAGPPASATIIDPTVFGATYNQYALYWTMNGNTYSDPCSCYTDGDGNGAFTRNGVSLAGNIYLNPCDFATSYYNCEGTLLGKTNQITIGQGLAIQNNVTSCSEKLIIGLNANVTSNDGSVIVNTSTSPCETIWDLSVEGAGCPTITATATTGDPGSSASVTVDDSSPCSPVFNFTIPQGIQGIQGDPGTDGTDGSDGSDGATGPQGPQGDPGPCPSVSASGSVTVSDGATPAVNITATDSSDPCGVALEFDFTLPCPVINASGTVTLSDGATPAVTITNTQTDSPCTNALAFAFTLPCPTITATGTVTVSPGATPGVSITNTPTDSPCTDALSFAFTLDDPTAYTPGNPGNWSGSPTTVSAALDRIAAAVAGLLGGSIP